MRPRKFIVGIVQKELEEAQHAGHSVLYLDADSAPVSREHFQLAYEAAKRNLGEPEIELHFIRRPRRMSRP